ncbi:MAG: YceI family protein [Pseudomonadota bacterium]
MLVRSCYQSRVKWVAAGLCSVLLAGCVTTEQSLAPIDTSNFELEPTHAFLTAKVRHFGISDYSIDFNGLSGQLDFDADDPVQSAVSIQIDAAALETNFPDPEGKAEWETELATGGRFLDGENFPTVTFVSTRIEQTGAFTGTLTGDLNLRGVTRPVTLDVMFNGTATSPLDGGRRRVGFNANGTFNRSDFGMGALSQFVSDEVRVEFSGEFIEPAR